MIIKSMKLQISLILWVLLICVFCNIGFSRNLQERCQSNKPSDEVKQLIKQINLPNDNGTNFEEIKNAIDRLGDLHAVVAIDDLARLFPLRKPVINTDVDNTDPIIPPEKIFPARRALIKIGECSIPKMIEIIKENPQDSFLSGSAEDVVINVKKLNFLQTASLFNNAARTTKSKIEKERLRHSALKFIDLEKKMHN